MFQHFWTTVWHTMRYWLLCWISSMLQGIYNKLPFSCERNTLQVEYKMKHIQLMKFKVQIREIKQKCLLMGQIRGIEFYFSNLQVLQNLICKWYLCLQTCDQYIATFIHVPLQFYMKWKFDLEKASTTYQCRLTHWLYEREVTNAVVWLNMCHQTTQLGETWLWHVKKPTLCRKSAHRWQWACQPHMPAMLYSPETFLFLSLILISARGWLNPRA
jgi:hypothetical protein